MSTTTRLSDRRELLAAAASAAAVVSLPLRSLATPALGAPAVREPLADWSIDDQWGVVPRWDSIPCVPQHRDDERVALLHPADRAFLA